MDRLVYTKYSTDRDERFAIRTDRMLGDDGCENILKIALFDEGVSHLKHMVTMSELLQERYGDKISVSKSMLKGNVLHNEYVSGDSLYNKWDRLIDSKDKDLIKGEFDHYINVVNYSKKDLKEFLITEEFVTVFGREEELECSNLLSANVTDVDMILENIIVADDGKWQLIDYEWSFDFPIPQEYVVYRTLMYLYNNSRIGSIIPWNEALRWADISDLHEKCYERMEKHFQDYIVLGKKNVEQGVLDSGNKITPFSDLIKADTLRDEMIGNDDHFSDYEQLLGEYNKYKQLAKENNDKYNTLQNAYALQQVELDNLRQELDNTIKERIKRKWKKK